MYYDYLLVLDCLMVNKVNFSSYRVALCQNTSDTLATMRGVYDTFEIAYPRLLKLVS